MKIILTDPIGTAHIVAQTPQRIISLVPSLTELVCDLGLEQRLVGITKFCVHPYRLKSQKTIVGGTKKVNYDKIKALNPDFILANKEENTLEMVGELSEICPVWVTDISTIEDLIQTISDFGQLFNCRTESIKLSDKINFAHADFVQFMTGRPIYKTAYFIWKNPFMAAGGNTFIDELLAMNHFENIYRDKGRYPEVRLGRIRLEGDPELVLLSSEPYPFKDEDAFEIGRFTHHAKTVFVDGEMFSWYGSRLLKAFDYFKTLQLAIQS